jgi:hypothetical protein
MNTDVRYAISKWNWNCQWSMILLDARIAVLKQIAFIQHLDWFSKGKDFIEQITLSPTRSSQGVEN